MLDDIHALLDALRLRHARAVVAEAIKAAQKSKPSYSAFLLELLRREHEGQRDRSIANRLKRSGLDEFWTLETFPFHIQKCVNKKIIYELAELDFIARGESLVFIGQAAVGKSGLASGILMKALYAGKRGQAIKADALFEDLKNSHADRTTRRRIQKPLAPRRSAYRRVWLCQRTRASADQRFLPPYGQPLQSQEHDHHNEPGI